MPKYSIIIPLYNKEKTIQRTITSILSQNYSDFEAIIVNDGSKDKGFEKAKEVKDSRLIFIDKENGGVSSARNKGILASSGEWIIFIDADDILYPNALDVYNKLQSKYPEINVHCGSMNIGKKKYPQSEKTYLIKNLERATIYSVLRTGFAILCTDSICVRRKCFDEVGMFNTNYSHGEDLDMWNRLNEKYIFSKAEETVAFYDLDADNRSTDLKKENVRTWIKTEVPYVSMFSLKTPFYKKAANGLSAYNHMFLNCQSIKDKIDCYSTHLGCINIYIAMKFLNRIKVIQSR